MAAETGSANMNNAASLLGLPRELRLHIYDHLFAHDLNHIISYGMKEVWLRKELRHIRVAELNEEQPLSIPWLNLMLTCKSTATELRSLMRDQSFRLNERNLTYILALEGKRKGTSLGETVWRQIPCGPNQAEYLEVHFNASRGFHPWGDGGPHIIVSSLYQTLNRLLHYGPRIFDSKTPLAQHMRLKELRIVVDTHVEDEQNKEDYIWFSERDVDPETTALALGSFVGQVNNTGVLKGYIDHIQLPNPSSGKVLNWAVDESAGTGEIPDLWRGNGFEWGVQ